MSILLIMAHPRKDSFSSALADSYFRAALEAKQEIKKLQLCEMEFVKDVLHRSPKEQKIEPCIREAQELIRWANHLVFVYPTWWGTFPALLKSFFDRTFTEGFAFDEVEGGTGFKKLLRNKSAQIFTTMDTPSFVYKYFHKAPGNRAIGSATLKFCGISPISFKSFGPIRGSTKEKRQKWLEEIRNSASDFANVRTQRKINAQRNLNAWLQAVRFQFYPLSSLAYLLGSLLIVHLGGVFDYFIFFIGLLWIFFLEFTTVLINEKEDFETDKNNPYYSQFSGGSRVLVDGLLTINQVNKGIMVNLVLSSIMAAMILLVSPASLSIKIVLIGISTFLSLGYTAPPFKLGYRGLAAIDVGLTHSFGLLVSAFAFQGGNLQNPMIWLICIPLFFSILPSIILAGVPDRKADSLIGKKTIAVRFGRKNAAKIAVFSIISTIFALVLLYFTTNVSTIYSPFIFLSVVHSLYIAHKLIDYIKNDSPPERIDGLIVVSLSLILWFVLIPILSILL